MKSRTILSCSIITYLVVMALITFFKQHEWLENAFGIMIACCVVWLLISETIKTFNKYFKYYFRKVRK